MSFPISVSCRVTRWVLIFGALMLLPCARAGATVCAGGGADDWVGCAFMNTSSGPPGISLNGLLLTINQPDQRGYALARWPNDLSRGWQRLSIIKLGINPKFVLNSSILYTGHAGLVNPGCTGRCSEIISIGSGIDDSEMIVGASIDDSFLAEADTHAEANGATDTQTITNTATGATAEAQAQAFAAKPGVDVQIPTGFEVTWSVFSRTLASVDNGPLKQLNETMFAMDSSGMVTTMNLTPTGSLASGTFGASGTFSHEFDFSGAPGTESLFIEEETWGFLRVARQGTNLNMPEPPPIGLFGFAIAALGILRSVRRRVR